MRFRALSLLYFCCFAGQAQWPATGFDFEPGAGALVSRYDSVAWPSPESIVRDLRSDDETRFQALRLFGYPDAEMREVPKPDEIELRYATIGDDKRLDAVIAVTVKSRGGLRSYRGAGSEWVETNWLFSMLVQV